jgi:hypothetical protein
LLAVPKSLP